MAGNLNFLTVFGKSLPMLQMYYVMYYADFTEAFYIAKCHGVTITRKWDFDYFHTKVLPSLLRFPRNSLNEQIFVDLVHRSSPDPPRNVDNRGENSCRPQGTYDCL
jgi:hypothetical protein